MSSILFISFDIRKDEYPSMSYSIASLAAAVKEENHIFSHYSFDLQHSLEEKMTEESILDNVVKKFEANKVYFLKFDFIAVSLTSWSIEYCVSLLSLLNDFKGKVIVGGYEVTSRNSESLNSLLPRADYFIKGYAEKALKNILSGRIYYNGKFINDPIEESDLVSPYLSGILSTVTRKIHWETKRGCPYKCGFCEWGNATDKVIFLGLDRLKSEIELFRISCIDEINILDGTFNFGKYYLDIFSLLLDLKEVKITCQAKFENLLKTDGEKFLQLCKNASDRVHLEFGLQTIDPKEMKTIGRVNDLKQIEQALHLLKEYGIDYEVSIIYAIPGQTIESFIDTIEFLITKGCRNIKAYPLSIPKNSAMELEKNKLCVKEGKNKYNVFSVISSYSFPAEQRIDMDRIANRLNVGDFLFENRSEPMNCMPGSEYSFHKVTKYQWEITEILKDPINEFLFLRIISDYISQTIADIEKEDFRQSLISLGRTLEDLTVPGRRKLINDFLTGKECLEIKTLGFNNEEPVTDIMIKELLSRINKNLLPRKYKLKIRVSVSGNLYVYRDIIYEHDSQYI